MQPKTLIVITHNGWINSDLTTRLIQWGKRYDILTIRLQPVDYARNFAVKRFLQWSESEEGRLLFIDNDIVPPPDVIEKLISHDKDIISGLCLCLKGKSGKTPYPTPMTLNEVRNPIYSNGLQRVSYVGTGCLMIKKKVLMKNKRNFYLTYDEEGCILNSEDYNFCDLARGNGYEIWADYDIICDHVKDVSLLGFNNALREVSQK